MAWTSIADEAVDAGSPTPASLAVQYRDNAEYNYNHALRGGTHAAGQRLVIARGTKTFTGTGTDLDFSSAVTFATDSTDGDPDFGAAPVVILQIEEVLTYDDEGIIPVSEDWIKNLVVVNRLFIQDSSLTTSGFTAEINLTLTGSHLVNGILHWMAIGTPNVEAEYTTIAGTDTDQNSPFEEDLTVALRDNQVYDHDHAVRCGTHKNGARLAIARGTAAFFTTGNSSYFQSYIDFSADATDGDPNFLSPPIMLFGLEETIDSSEDWATNNVLVNKFPYIGYDWSTTTWVTETDCSVWYLLNNGTANDIKGNLHWIAIGPVTAGE